MQTCRYQRTCAGLNPFILSVLTCGSVPQTLQHNLEGVLGFELAREDYERISAIGFQLRLVDGIRYLRLEGPFRCCLQPLVILARHY